MSICILSDTHIGDRSSRIMNSGKFISSNSSYRIIKENIFSFTGNKPLEFLVISGDIMDFSINSISDSINKARPFLQQISDDKLCRRIVYIPGNHDKQVWDGLQWDTSIIGNLSENHPAKPFVHIQPAVIKEFKKIELEGIKPGKKDRFDNVFLKGLFIKKNGNPDIILAYPNLYIKMKDETIIITHGHIFETPWVLLSTLLRGVADIPFRENLKDLEELNIPLTSMLATSLGSGGKVSDLFYSIESEAYENKTGILSKTLNTVIPRLRYELDLPWYKRLLFPGWIIKKLILSAASGATDPREYDDYLADRNNSRHFQVYLNATRSELDRLKLPQVNKIIFGHTHSPYPYNRPYTSDKFPGIEFYNTGGWLKENKAEVFLIDGTRFTSFSA